MRMASPRFTTRWCPGSRSSSQRSPGPWCHGFHQEKKGGFTGKKWRYGHRNVFFFFWGMSFWVFGWVVGEIFQQKLRCADHAKLRFTDIGLFTTRRRHQEDQVETIQEWRLKSRYNHFAPVCDHGRHGPALSQLRCRSCSSTGTPRPFPWRIWSTPPRRRFGHFVIGGWEKHGILIHIKYTYTDMYI